MPVSAVPMTLAVLMGAILMMGPVGASNQHKLPLFKAANSLQHTNPGGIYSACTPMHMANQKLHKVACHKSSTNGKNVKKFYKKHQGQEGILFCTGPSLDDYIHNDYHPTGNKYVTAGVNSIIYHKDIVVDYLFVGEMGAKSGGTGYAANKKKFDSYTPNIAKFYAQIYDKGHYHGGNIKTSRKAMAGVRRYEVYGNDDHRCSVQGACSLQKDPGGCMMAASQSTIFHALQFILYTGVSKLFIVGCDVTGGGHAKHVPKKLKGRRLLATPEGRNFTRALEEEALEYSIGRAAWEAAGRPDAEELEREALEGWGLRGGGRSLLAGKKRAHALGISTHKDQVGRLINAWKTARTFIECNYPSVDVRMVNPVGLKGTGFKHHAKHHGGVLPHHKEMGNDVAHMEYDVNEKNW